MKYIDFMNEITRSDKIDKLQRSEYSFPYHYIPNLNYFPNFAKIWLFGASYIAAINIFSNWFNGLNKKKYINTWITDVVTVVFYI